MTVDFNTLLSNDQKRTILQERINVLAKECYVTKMNMDTFVVINNEEKIAECEQVLKTLEVSLALASRELERIPTSDQEAALRQQ